MNLVNYNQNCRNDFYNHKKVAWQIVLSWLLCAAIFLSACNNNKTAEKIKPASESVIVAKPTIIEIVESVEGEINSDTLIAIARRNGIPGVGVHKWNNHFVIFGNMSEPQTLRNEISSRSPDSEVKIYDDMFYEFDRSKNCGNTTIAKEWDNILLTANMVSDISLQNEYLQYHGIQFTKWPEISKGFCNAEFQRLLLFKNGRQLMLVISIPKGKSLDELNPKTTLNNPRVDEWNALMKKYQEGIAGTKPGEVWVFLNKL